MKKIISILLLAVLCLSFVSCGESAYDKYVNTELESTVTVEMYVQATQSWWDNKITVYGADEDGAYFVYELACSEADAAKLTPGTKIEVTGRKTAWEGEVEIMDATFKFAGEETYVAEAVDLTNVLAKADELIEYQNRLAIFKGLTVVKYEYQGGVRGKDIYLTLSDGTNEYSFCVEQYLTGPDSDVYKAVEALVAGDKVDVEGFVYWYANAVNPHVTAVTKK